MVRLNDAERLWQSLSIGDMVYICNAKGDEELYNIAADPAEAHNLAGSADARPALEHFRTSLKRLLADSPDRGTPGRIVGQGGSG